MPFYVRDYLVDTMHLSPEGHGVYLLLILNYWNERGPIKNDTRSIKNITKSNSKKLIDSILNDFFVLSNGYWRHNRIDLELEKAHVKRVKAQASANARWGNDSNKDDANALRTHMRKDMLGACSSPSPSHTPTKEEGKKTRKRFQKPTSSELKEYSASISFQDFDAEKFLDYYDSNGWKVGKNPMVDWKATVRGWKKNGSNGKAVSKPVYKHGGEVNFEL